MQPTLYRMVLIELLYTGLSFSMEQIDKLKRADQIKGKVMEFMTGDDLIGLAKLSEIPHYIVTNPFTKKDVYCFLQEEINEWFRSFVKKRNRTVAPAITFSYPELPPSIHANDIVPPGLTTIKGLRKMPMSAFYTPPGIYFLCLGPEIVYIGQAINVAKRLTSHMGEKDFDSVYFISCHIEQLIPLESSLIRYYKPCLNIAEAGHPLKEGHKSCLEMLGVRFSGSEEKNQPV